MPLEKVFTALADHLGTKIEVNWKAINSGGIDEKMPVSLSLKDVSAREALRQIIHAMTNRGVGYTVSAGKIVVTTDQDLASYQVVRVYDIRDMLFQPATLPAASPGQQGGGGFGSGKTGSQQMDLVNNIIQTIEAVVAPDSWRESGGSIGSIRELNGQLIVNQTVENQLKVYNLLQQLRETRAIQVAVETRVLLVSSKFFDDFRVGWNSGLFPLRHGEPQRPRRERREGFQAPPPSQPAP